MSKLIPLNQLPYHVRRIEAAARAEWPTRAMALDAATVCMQLRPGCYSGTEAPTIGWLLTMQAGQAMADRVTVMPGGTRHRRLEAVEDVDHVPAAIGAYLEACARDGSDVGRAAALAAYAAAAHDA